MVILPKNAYFSLLIGTASGFNALFGGMSCYEGSFFHGTEGYYWSTSSFDKKEAWCIWMNGDHKYVYVAHFGKHYGFSIRCLKD